MSELTELERQVMEMLLAGEDGDLAILRAQLESASIVERKMTGAGFYTRFRLEAQAPLLPNGPSFTLGDVQANIPGLKFGAGFLLFVKQGCLSMLEGYSYEEPWPEDVSQFALSYVSHGKPSATRDLAGKGIDPKGGHA